MTTALHIPQGGFVFRIVKVAVDTFTVFSFGPLNQFKKFGLKKSIFNSLTLIHSNLTQPPVMYLHCMSSVISNFNGHRLL